MRINCYLRVLKIILLNSVKIWVQKVKAVLMSVGHLVCQAKSSETDQSGRPMCPSLCYLSSIQLQCQFAVQLPTVVTQ